MNEQKQCFQMAGIRKTGKIRMTQQDLLIKQLLKDGEMADILYFLDEKKIAQEAQYDGLYAVCTDLFDDEPEDILKVSESRWQIEACFRIMKTDFSARPVFVQRNDRIRAHFLICFLALFIYRLLEKKLERKYTGEELLSTMNLQMCRAGIHTDL